MPIHDLRCTRCKLLEVDVIVSERPYPRCPACDGERDWVPAKVVTQEWGQSRYFKSLDKSFSSRSEFRKYLKANHCEEAGDKVGGARNEDHLRLGKSFSYGGQAKRSDNPLAGGG